MLGGPSSQEALRVIVTPMCMTLFGDTLLSSEPGTDRDR